MNILENGYLSVSIVTVNTFAILNLIISLHICGVL